MAKKWTKALLGLVITGAAIGGTIAYKIQKDKDFDEFDDSFEDEDFDLDADLGKSSGRGYVSLNLNPAAEEDTAEQSEEEKSEETIAEQPETTEENK